MREKLIELVHDARMNALWHNAKKPDEYITDMLIDNGVTIAKDNNVPSKWIPVSEPPKEKGRYWCNVKSFSFPGRYYQTVLKWDDGFIEGSIYTDDVTHWMPLPEPPKGE